MTDDPSEILIRELAALAGPGLTRQLSNALRRGGRRVVTQAVKTFQSRGVGRRIFHGAKGRKAARGMIKLSRTKISGDTVTAEITATGLAGIQEKGGALKPHTIKPKVAKALAFVGSGGSVVVKSVRHPGGSIPAIPAVGPAISSQADAITKDIREAVNDHIREAAKHAVL